jgi:hypothetical protein
LKTLKRMCKEADKVYDKVIDEYFQKRVGEVEFDYDDAVILGLLENLINHTKTLILLIEKEHYASIDTVLRTFFENYVYLQFVLEKDTDLRAKSYFYSTKMKEMNIFNSITEESLSGNKLRKFLGVEKEDIINKFSKQFNSEKISSISKLYLVELGMQRPEQKWFNINGKFKSLKDVCASLELTVEYNLIYSTLSTETHAKDALKNFYFEENRVNLLSNLKKDQIHTSLCELYLLNSVRLIYKYYELMKELKMFNKLIEINYRIGNKLNY